MPPQAAAAAQDPNQDYVAVDPKQNPLAFIYQNRDALGNMPEDKAIKFVDRMFKRYALPKYMAMNRQKPLEQEEIENLRLQFAARMFNLPFEPVEQKGDKTEPGLVKKTGAALAAGGAGVIGGLRSIQELREKLQKYAGLEGLVKYDPLDRLIKKTLSPSGPAARIEGRAFSEAESTSPIAAHVSAAIGHQIPASIVTSGVGSILPSAGKAAPLAQKILMGGSRGAVEGGVFEASRPGGQPQSGANWGAALGAVFPVLGKFFGLGAKKIAPKVAEAVSGEGADAGAAKAAPVESKSLGSLADKAAKDKFGKSFKDLTSAEKAQMPSIMKEEIAKQRAQQAATKKAEIAAAKAGREAEAAAKRAAAADAAKQKAAQQATKRAGGSTVEGISIQSHSPGQSTYTAMVSGKQVSFVAPSGLTRNEIEQEARSYAQAKQTVIPTQTPAAKQAVAAKASEENPAVAKMMGGINAAGMEQSLKEKTPAELAQALRVEIDELKSRIKPGADNKIIEDRIAENEKMIKEYDEKAKITKVPEGQTGPKVRAKGGQPASPAQQKADADRIAAKRAEAKSQEFGAALEKHAQQMAGRYTPESLANVDVISLEETAKEVEGGDMIISAMKKMVRQKKWSEELYKQNLKDWLIEYFKKN